MNASRFSLPLRLLHWLMALLLLAMLLIGTAMVATVSRWHNVLLDLHKPLGLALLVLALLRLAIRLRGQTPALPSTLPAPLRLAAHLSHYLLYGAMLAMPLIGWAMQSAGGLPLPLIGAHALPALLSPSVVHYALLRQAHTWLGELFFVLVLGHIMAGLMHAWLLRDGVFDTISLGRKA